MSEGSLNVTPRLSGIIPPLVTPLTDHDTIDVQGTRRLLDHVIDGGVSGVFILGTTGEAPSLSYELRRSFIRLVNEHTAGRVPVLVGITDTSFVESLALAHVAAESGATAAVLATPYYFPAGQTELIRYIHLVVEQLPLPLVLYNMPSLTKVWLDVETLDELASVDQIIGVKDSSGDVEYFRQVTELKQRRPDWSIFMGPEHLLGAAIASGGDGGVCGGANIYPELFVDCYRAAVAGDAAATSVLSARIDLLQEIYTIGKYASRHIKATKCACSLRGLCSDVMAPPFNHFLPPERARVLEILRRLGDDDRLDTDTGDLNTCET